LSQNVEAHFRSTFKNFSTNIVSKSKKSLMSKVKMRFLRFSQLITQISIWFLNDDCFNVWNFSCNCFFIWSSIFLYLMIKSCNIFFMKIDIISKRIYDLAKTRIASSILSILWEILTISFFFCLYSFTLVLQFFCWLEVNLWSHWAERKCEIVIKIVWFVIKSFATDCELRFLIEKWSISKRIFSLNFFILSFKFIYCHTLIFRIKFLNFSIYR
jgi:hypothetical protein